MNCTSRRLMLSAVVVPVALPGLLLAQAFEGKVTGEMNGPGGPMPVVILAKGAKSRMEMNAMGMQMFMIMDGEAGTMMMVMPAQQMYTKTDLRAAAAQMGATTHAAPKIERTGRHETIAGKDCEHVLITPENGKPLDICGATGMGYFAGPGGGPMGRGRSNTGVPGMDEMMKQFKNGFFPLKMEMIDGTTRTQMLLVTKIEPQRVDESVFQAPAGYQEMPGMPGRP